MFISCNHHVVMVMKQLYIVQYGVRLLQLLQIDQPTHPYPRHEPVLAIIVRYKLKMKTLEASCRGVLCSNVHIMKQTFHFVMIYNYFHTTASTNCNWIWVNWNTKLVAHMFYLRRYFRSVDPYTDLSFTHTQFDLRIRILYVIDIHFSNSFKLMWFITLKIKLPESAMVLQ